MSWVCDTACEVRVGGHVVGIVALLICGQLTGADTSVRFYSVITLLIMTMALRTTRKWYFEFRGRGVYTCMDACMST